MFIFIVVLLAIVVLFFHPKKSFPLFVFFWLVFNYEIKSYGPLNYFSFIYLVYYLTYFLLFKKKLFKKYRWITILLIWYLSFAIFKTFEWGGLSFFHFVKYFKPLFFQFWVIIAFGYLKCFKKHFLLFKAILIGGIIYIIRIIFISLSHGFSLFHNADLGLICSVIISLILFYFPYKQENDWIVNKILKIRIVLLLIFSLIPLLGMGRGSTIAVMIPWTFYFLLQRKLILSFKIILLSTFIISTMWLSVKIIDVLPNKIIYMHQGASNLPELYAKTKNVGTTIYTRILRWEILIDEFKKNPILGGKGFKDPVLDEVNKGFTAWGAHAYFFAIMGGGGLFLLVPTLIIVLFWINKSLKLYKNNSNNYILAVILILNAININLTNCYYAGGYSALPMWIFTGIAIEVLINNGKTNVQK